MRVGISACLLGEPVRYNGAHKLAPWLDALAPHVEWISVCPEVECGMGVPREPVRLELAAAGPRMIGNFSAVDYTTRMTTWAEARIEGLLRAKICGCVVKKDSPSCGAGAVPLFRDGLLANRDGRGLFAAALLARVPHLPVVEEDALADADGRIAFLERCRVYARRHV